jgi:hypothetical protein
MIIASTASDSLGYAFYGSMHSEGVGIAKWWRIHMLFLQTCHTQYQYKILNQKYSISRMRVLLLKTIPPRGTDIVKQRFRNRFDHATLLGSYMYQRSPYRYYYVVEGSETPYEKFAVVPTEPGRKQT